MREIVSAVVTGLHGGRFIEETLEALCVQIGATSAWSTLETKGSGGPMHRSRTASFRGVSPAVLAQHVADSLGRVQAELETIAGLVPYASEGSFIAVPLWSRPTGSRRGRNLIGAMYLEFADDRGTNEEIWELVEWVGALLGGVIAQQSLIEATQEDLRVERAKDRNDIYLTLDDLLGFESMTGIRQELRAAAASQSSIMILGESGTGKTQLATAFARASKQEPIVRATLGMADDLNTITSELFGHERGSFSGAVSKRIGLVEYANGGTLILDEVLNLPLNAQQLLLDFAQFGSYRPLGYQGRNPKTASLRLISVTNGNIEEGVVEGRFRRDLYYRLATVPIVLPALRERRHEIPAIAARYLGRADAQDEWELDGGAVEALTSPHLGWNGNIRELEAVLERARSRARANGLNEAVIEARHLDLDGSGAVDSRAPGGSSIPPNFGVQDGIEGRWRQLTNQKADLDAVEKAVIEEALAACEGIVARTARMLSVPRTGLISRMATLDIDPEQFKRRR
jgi:DNA-binding NtrC family response regulator